MPRKSPYTRTLVPEKLTVWLYPEFREALKMCTNGGCIRGYTTGMAYRAYWRFLFVMNEALPREKKMTDFAIAKNIQMEYPHHKHTAKLTQGPSGQGVGRYTVRYYRKMYNYGCLGNRPKDKSFRMLGPVSYRYNNEGLAISNVYWNSIKPLTNDEIMAIAKRFGNEEYLKHYKPPLVWESNGLDEKKSVDVVLRPDTHCVISAPRSEKERDTEGTTSTENG